ncbi:hypothetical protein I79_010331 [Cricetulus griseus]|uniref:Uncharacterized protein n=1 Tax=Cricetulus griseus TaxID=10029 RepID=G3HI64_CRIGR|nr:hypothetical protein I79_010331 [Cricetulus griseus]
MAGDTWQAQMCPGSMAVAFLAPYAGSAGSGDPAPERLSPWLLGGGGHLGGDKSLDDTMVGWQQVAVPIGGVGALVQHQAAGRHCRSKCGHQLSAKPL